MRTSSLAVWSVYLLVLPCVTWASPMQSIYNELVACSPELIEQQASVEAALGNIEAEKARRLPSFSLSASGKKYASSDHGVGGVNGSSDTSARVIGEYTLYSFGKQAAKERLAEEAFLVSLIEQELKSQSVLSDLLLKQASVEKLNDDLAVIERILVDQEALWERVKRRVEMDLSSETDANAVFTKVWNNKNAQKENRLQLDILKSQIGEIACTTELQGLKLESLPKHDGDSAEGLVNSKLRLAKAKLKQKVQALEQTKLALRPDINVNAEVPLDDTAKDASLLGLEFAVEYGHLGQVNKTESLIVEKEIQALKRKLEVETSRHNDELSRLSKEHESLTNFLIPNQKIAIEAVRKKLGSKLRLFKAGRVSLFELMQTYDEVQSTEIQMNKLKFDLAETNIQRATALDYLYR